VEIHICYREFCDLNLRYSGGLTIAVLLNIKSSPVALDTRLSDHLHAGVHYTSPSHKLGTKPFMVEDENIHQILDIAKLI
jgi:hypothetical protein